MSLIDRQGGRDQNCSAIPAVPSASLLLPFMPPVVAPAWRAIWTPPVKIGRGSTVVAYGNAQNKERHRHRGYKPPRAVVPGTCVPVVPFVHPVLAIVEEEIRVQAGRVVHRVAWHPHELRVARNIDADSDTHLSRGRTHRPEQHREHDDQGAHHFSFA
jgi:hypothetical protein